MLLTCHTVRVLKKGLIPPLHSGREAIPSSTAKTELTQNVRNFTGGMFACKVNRKMRVGPISHRFACGGKNWGEDTSMWLENISTWAKICTYHWALCVCFMKYGDERKKERLEVSDGKNWSSWWVLRARDDTVSVCAKRIFAFSLNTP